MDEPSITLHIKFGRDSLQAALPTTASVKDLKAHLQSLTNVLPRGQKLIFKGKILEDSVTLKAANLSDGSKIMLMASHGVHQGGGPVKKDSPQPVSRKGLEAKPTRKPNMEKATEITRLQRWKATGVISLSESGLEVVPQDVFAVGASTRVLDIGDNCLQEVPAEIGNLSNLQKLRLTANNLSDDRLKWQGLVSLKCLTVLALNCNRLCQLPAEIGILHSLKQLNLAHNNLASIPEEIGQLRQLEILKLNNNCLEALPLTIGDCCSLLEADFSSNLLGEIPSTLGNLQNIKVSVIMEIPKSRFFILLKEGLTLVYIKEVVNAHFWPQGRDNLDQEALRLQDDYLKTKKIEKPEVTVKVREKKRYRQVDEYIPIVKDLNP